MKETDDIRFCEKCQQSFHGGEACDCKSQTTRFSHRKQTMKFEVELNGIGWGFSLGVMIDALRKAVEPAFPHIASRTKVSILSVELEKE